MGRVRVFILAEGPAEKAFIRDVLQPHLGATMDLIWRGARTKGNKTGGVPKYERLKGDLEGLFKENKSNDVRFTCMLDLFRLPKGYPGWKTPQDEPNPLARAESVEGAMLSDIQDERGRFIPYIQTYEFEALLLAERSPIDIVFPGPTNELDKLWAEVARFDSPEEINDTTPPGKLLCKHWPRYRKAADAALVFQHLSLAAIRAKCPHFDAWVCKLEALGGAS